MTDTLDRLDKLMIGLREREVSTIDAYRELVKLFPEIKEAVTLHDQVKTPVGFEAITVAQLKEVEQTPPEGYICKEGGTFEGESLKAATLKWSLWCEARQHIPKPLSALLRRVALYLPSKADSPQPMASYELLNEAFLQIDSELASTGIYTRDLAENPKKALSAVIQWHVDVALDPQVSARAQALRDDGAVGAIKAALSDEMRGINETPQKEQTQDQKVRLALLRQEATALHYHRITLNQKNQKTV